MRSPIGDLFSIGSLLKAGVQSCHLFENGLMATSKRSKETQFEKNTIFNLKLYEKGNRTFSFKLVFTFLLLDVNI